ncbi:hypothetical protein RB195_024940 [Necator americanus]|uniref:Uncharacterized protein n=1 Tax=Necator americanus TaxID=51031 RepID=A0ABR1EQ77_NECAM
MRRIVGQCPADIVLALSDLLTNLEYADNVIFVESSMKLQHVVNLVSKPMDYVYALISASRCGLLDISKSGWNGQPIVFVDNFSYLGCMLKNNGSYKKDVQQRCAKATFAFNSLKAAYQESEVARISGGVSVYGAVYYGDRGGSAHLSLHHCKQPPPKCCLVRRTLRVQEWRAAIEGIVQNSIQGLAACSDSEGDERNYPSLHNIRPCIRILHLKSVPPQIRGMLPLKLSLMSVLDKAGILHLA